ncbi:MAG: carbohydrate ABC transporter permease [Thermomicrobiales bacterium]
MTASRSLRGMIWGRFLDVITYAVVILFLLPILWLVSTAFKTRADAFAMPPIWVFTPTFDNFAEALNQAGFLHQYGNSIIVAVATTAISLLLGVPAAYGLTRFRFRGKRAVALFILSTRFVPFIGMLFPLYIIFNALGLLDTYQGLIILHVTFALVTVIWMMRGYFMQVPVELEEASMCDGTSRLGALFRVVIPLAAPGMAAVSVFTFIISWNEFLFALMFTRNQVKTAPVALVSFMSFEGINWGPMAAAGLLVLAPVFLFSLFVLRYLVAGLSMGAVKD